MGILCSSVVANIKNNTAMVMPKAAFSLCWPIKVMGAPDMMPCNLAKAMTEPEKVMAPMAVPRPISTRLMAGMEPMAPRP